MPRQTWRDYSEIICSLRLGFFKFFSNCFGKKITSESRILTVLWINSERRPGGNVSLLDPTKSTEWWEKEFIQKAAVSWTPREGKCPTARPRGLRVPAPSAASPFSGTCPFSVTQASDALHTVPWIGQRPPRSVSRRIWPPRRAGETNREHPSFPRKLRGPTAPAQRTPLPEGLGLDLGRKWLRGAEPGGS